MSIVSRVQRSFQLRATSVTLDDAALDFVREDADDYGAIRIVANEPATTARARSTSRS